MVLPLPMVTLSPRVMAIQLSGLGSGLPLRNRSLAKVTPWPIKQFLPVVTFSHRNEWGLDAGAGTDHAVALDLNKWPDEYAAVQRAFVEVKLAQQPSRRQQQSHPGCRF
ncbi:Uncharacterised protein [Cedecea neteri]|uniref:Uncharacterized protein n=1 Tax=Cedecea neteri TaxID=158822 RepID=A0A2X2VBL5_9ENTR|nr:Uncharacterised protein [Cedecea neteri]